MNKLKKYKYCITVLALGILLVSSCKKDDILLKKETDAGMLRVGDYIANNYDCQILAAALEYTGLMDTLNNGQKTYTLLAPDDDAFNRIGINSASDITKLNKDSLRQALLFHILPTRILQANLPMQHNYPLATLNGENIEVSRASVSDLLPSFSGAELQKATGTNSEDETDKFMEAEVQNGVVLRVDRPLRPFFHQTVQQYLETHSEYSIFVAGLKKFGLWDELVTDGKFTVMAPTNATLIKWGLTTEVLNRLNVSDYNGGLLFGSYIVYNRRLLIADFDYFYRTEDQTYYTDELRDAPGYYRFITGDGMTYFNYSPNNSGFGFITGYLRDRSYGFSYTLCINQANEPYGRFHYGLEANSAFVLGANDYPLGTLTTPPNKNQAWMPELLQQLPMGLERYKNNNLCSNGVVHPFHAIAVLPDEAKKK